MSQAGALARAHTLRESLLDHGVSRVSIELRPGRPGTPNGLWWDARFRTSMGHHIVSRRSQGLTPGLSLVKNGRSDVPGPLCNCYGGFDETARIICLGWANHPGEGGPLTVRGAVVPRDQGRPYLFGWEHEGGLALSDWTDSFRTFMGRCHAGTLDWLGGAPADHVEHKTWAPDRKIDRLGYTTTSARAEVARVWNDGPAGGDDMPLTDAEFNEIARRVHARSVQAGATTVTLGEAIGDALAFARRNEPAIAAMVAALNALAAGLGTSPEDLAQIRQAADAGATDALSRMIDDARVELVVDDQPA